MANNRNQKKDSIEFFNFTDDQLMQSREWEEVKFMLSKALSMCTPIELMTVLNVFAVAIGKTKEEQWEKARISEVDKDYANKSLNKESVHTKKVGIRHTDSQSDRIIELVTACVKEFTTSLSMIQQIDKDYNAMSEDNVLSKINTKEVASA